MPRILKTACALLVFIATLAPAGISQMPLDSLRLTFRAPEQPLPELLRLLEKQSGLRFYGPMDELRNWRAKADFDRARLPEILDKLLKTNAFQSNAPSGAAPTGTGFGYFFYRNYAVVIAPETALATVHSPEFYQVLQDSRTEEKRRPKATDSERKAQFAVGSANDIAPSGKARVRGKLRDAQTSEAIVGAAVQWADLPEKTAVSDKNGQFEAVLPIGERRFSVRYIGYETLEGTLKIFNDGDITLRIEPTTNALAEVLVRAEAADANVSKAQISVAKLDPRQIKRLPTLLGEADVVRGLLTGTGVTSVGEGASGFNVRGGDVDQNLMLQDELVLFNSSHALGFFSTYNTDLVSKIELHKSIMPAQFGGRLASVLDVEMRDGGSERVRFRGGISPISARASVEIPVLKNRAWLTAGGRASFSDWALRLSRRLEVRRSAASFFDANLRYNHRLDRRNSLLLTGYGAGDEFAYAQQFGFKYQTTGGQITWKHAFADDFFSRTTVAAGDYSSEQTDFEGTDAGTLRNGVGYLKFRQLLTRYLSRDLQIDAGADAIFYRVRPGEQQPNGLISTIPAKTLETERGLESAIFGSAEWRISPQLTIVGGLRVNHFRFLGPKTVFEYGSQPPSLPTLADTIFFKKGETVAHFTTLEPRLSGRFRLDGRTSLKAGYSRTSQFINQVFNTDTPTPTSQFQLSRPGIPPFRAHNVAAGWFRNSRSNLWETSVEVFYRAIDQLWDYRDFAQLAANEHLETEIRTGIGRSYGLELNLKTTRERLNGQLGYTYARAQRKVPGVSRGAWYASSFDKPHTLNLVLNVMPSQRRSLTFNFTYSTGRPATAPATSYTLQHNIVVPVYSKRNGVRIPDYHRLDVAYNIGRGYNKKKTLKTSWNLSVYNVYARKNAFSVFFTQDPDGAPVANRLAILGAPFPAITLNLETI